MMCDGTLIANDETVNASLPYARNTEAFKDIRCEIQRLGGPYIGDVVLTASTIDEVIQFSDTRNYQFEKPAAEEGFFSKNINGPTLIAVGIGVLILIAILFIARKQRNTPVEEETFISGPPISQQTIVQTVPTQATVEVVTEAATETSTPPLPDGGLPDGWSMEQWIHYGQQYLDRLGK